ncbi:hypothetical protein VNI00_010033 [Paramarasmius palmivorus]|uniref:Uncharacterized protein n=1 Tax=Paramarasmius palmivorus TaxID=297713 RepID=A0AAW0CQT1_9AGAR
MPRENSFTDSEGRSLTPDLSEEEDNDAPPISPTYATTNLPQIPSPIEPDLASQSQSPRQHASSSTSALRAKLHGLGSRSKHSIHSKVGSPTSVRPQMPPKERFRSAVRKVMAMHRSTSMMHMAIGGAGAEPGLDPRRASADLQFGGIRQDCVIELLDYSSLSHMYGRMTNKEFVNLMADPKASQREKWAKVRWINIGGLSWDVMKAISLKYDIHPLALEDVFHTRSQTRSKADYYPQHLFLRVLCHELGDDDDQVDTAAHTTAAYGSTLTDVPRSSSPLPFTDDERATLDRINDGDSLDYDEKTVFGSAPLSRKSTMRNRKQRSSGDVEQGISSEGLSSVSCDNRIDHSTVSSARTVVKDKKTSLLNVNRQGERVNVKVSPMFIFLFRDGTVISIHPETNLDITRPINRRLQQRDTGLRTSADPSLLVQSLIDLIVDKALEVIDAYHTQIKKFESHVLLRPEVSTVRNLHILSGDLILHKRTLEPIKTLVYGLRRYDLDRCAALVDPDQVAKKRARGEEVQVVGFMSHKSKIYLGMNFESMWSVQHNSDLLFWEIAIPVMLVVLPIFLVPDIKRVYRYIQKKMEAKRAVKVRVFDEEEEGVD